MTMQPRTKDTQATPTRPARFGHAKQRAVKFLIRGRDNFPGYVTALYPNEPLEDRKAMVNVLNTYVMKNGRVPTPNECNQIFEGLYVVPTDVPLNPRQNG